MVAEQLVIEAARTGTVVVCGDGDERGPVAADLLRSLCRERLARMLGWVLSSIFLLSFTRLARSA